MLKREKELVQKIKEQMPQFEGNKAEVEKNIAMFIYLMLGKEKVYDENFFLADFEAKNKMIKLHEKRKYTLNSIIKDRKLSCIQMADLYAKVLGDFKIKSKVERVNRGCAHYFNVIKFSDGEAIVADLQKDLPNIQTRSKIKYFGEKYIRGNEKISNEKMSENELIQMQKNCHYIENDSDYMDVQILSLAEKLKGLSPDKMLEEILKDDKVNKLQEDIGYIEFYNYYSHLIGKVARDYDKKQIDYFNCYRKRIDENGKTVKDYTMCIYSLTDDKADIYLYSQTDKSFKKTDIEKLKQIENQGLVLGKSQSEKGLQKLRKYMSEQTLKRYKAHSVSREEIE